MINDKRTQKSSRAPLPYNAISIIRFQTADIHKFVFQFLRINNMSTVNSI